MKETLHQQRLISQVQEAVEIGAYGVAEVGTKFWANGEVLIPIREKDSKETEFIVLVGKSDLKYFRLTR